MFWCLGSLRKHRATCVVCPQRPDAQRVRIEERRQMRQEKEEETNAAREGRGSRVYLRRCLFRIRQQERHQILISRGQSFRCARLARGLAALEASKSSAGFTPFKGQGNLQKDHDRVSYRARAVCFLSLAPPVIFPTCPIPVTTPSLPISLLTVSPTDASSNSSCAKSLILLRTMRSYLGCLQSHGIWTATCGEAMAPVNNKHGREEGRANTLRASGR